MSKRYPGVYRIVNTVTGDCYVGSSAYVQSRKSEHFQRLRKQTHANIHLQRVFDKYGEESLVFEVLERPPVEKLIEREQHWIDTLEPTYNIRKIAESNLGLKASDAAKAKQRQAWQALSSEKQEEARQNLANGRQKMMEMVANGEWQHSPETIEAIKQARASQVITPTMLETLKHGREIRKQVNPKPRQGMRNTEEHNQKIALSHLGMKATPESVEKMRTAKKGVKQSPEHIQKRAEGMRGHDVSEKNRQALAERSRKMWANRTPEEKRAVVEKRSEEVQEKNRQRMRELGKDPARIEASRQGTIRAKQQRDEAKQQAKMLQVPMSEEEKLEKKRQRYAFTQTPEYKRKRREAREEADALGKPHGGPKPDPSKPRSRHRTKTESTKQQSLFD